jgi:non-haem Fe2+, alpha-ketoglutarate-dependent halogenase
MRDLLGENVVCWGSHYFCKMPRDPKTVSWHQDSAYWPLSPSKTATVWLAIDDADPENASLRVVPGSHLHGLIPSRPSTSDENNVLWTSIDRAERFGEPVSLRLRAGQFSIHSDLVLHGSRANLSARRRCGLTLRYCPVDVRSYKGWNAQSIIVSGHDESGHWRHLPRPAGDDPFAKVATIATN